MLLASGYSLKIPVYTRHGFISTPKKSSLIRKKRNYGKKNMSVYGSKNPPAKQVAFLPKHAEEFKGKAFRLKKLHYE